MAVNTYSPKKVSISVAGVNITGFAEDTFVLVDRAVEAFTKQVGADGEVARTASADRTGTITITLLQTSSSNDILAALQQTDEKTLNGKFPVMVKDNNGTSVAAASTAWIDKMAPVEYGAETGEREWVIQCADLEHFAGGNS